MAPLSGVTLDAILKRNSLRRSPSGELYFRAFDGKLTALDLEIHKPLWVLQTNASKQNLLEFPTRTGPSFSGVVAQDFYADMVIGVHKLLSAGAILPPRSLTRMWVMSAVRTGSCTRSNRVPRPVSPPVQPAPYQPAEDPPWPHQTACWLKIYLKISGELYYAEHRFSSRVGYTRHSEIPGLNGNKAPQDGFA